MLSPGNTAAVELVRFPIRQKGRVPLRIYALPEPLSAFQTVGALIKLLFTLKQTHLRRERM